MFIGPAIVHKVFLAVALGMLTCSTRSALADDGRQRQLRSLPTTNKQCWVFHHMNKSGGTTIKFLLKRWLRDQGYKVGQFDNQEWLAGSAAARAFVAEDYDFTWGSYTEGLRRHGAEHCTWFTMFRHPVARVVSAFFYCRKPERVRDPLCASVVRRADTMDLLTFTKHWTNFGLRQFVTSFVLPEDVTTAPIISGMSPEVPGWYKLKTFFDHLQSQDVDDPVIDAGMYKFLQPAEALLMSKYKAVGVLENFNTTLHLFNRALALPNYDWLEEFDRVGAVNVNARGDEEHVLTEENRNLELAKTDVTMKRHLMLDLLLYEQAVAIHRIQLDQYGLA